MASAKRFEQSLDLSLDEGLAMPMNRALESGPRLLRDITLAEALNVISIMARQGRLDKQIDGDAQLLHECHDSQDSNEDWCNPGGICDEEGYAPACRCDEDPMSHKLPKDLDAWWRAGIYEQERRALCSTLAQRSNISPKSIAHPRKVCQNDCNIKGRGDMPEDASDDEDAALELTWWNPGGIVDADESYAPSCPCD
eukprot:TRINITY_DN16227_c0_g2_i1.p1 TRINITY_DN16227_c0_g2~~TRINITY_DN16227_c0_g2_i1.p1  ORF type:complete len:197 (+),score=44.81 TRINITY_DN16227_c0_g2_i1:69-659(+)